MNALARATVATLLTRLSDLPSDAEVVFYNDREHTVLPVINHITHDKRTNAAVLHIEELTPPASRVDALAPDHHEKGDQL